MSVEENKNLVCVANFFETESFGEEGLFAKGVHLNLLSVLQGFDHPGETPQVLGDFLSRPGKLIPSNFWTRSLNSFSSNDSRSPTAPTSISPFSTAAAVPAAHPVGLAVPVAAAPRPPENSLYLVVVMFMFVISVMFFPNCSILACAHCAPPTLQQAARSRLGSTPELPCFRRDSTH